MKAWSFAETNEKFITLQQSVSLNKFFYMSLQYLQNDKGETTAVLIPIEDWQRIKSKHPDITTDENMELPQWQKDLIDSRVAAIAKNTERLKDIDELLMELDNDE